MLTSIMHNPSTAQAVPAGWARGIPVFSTASVFQLEESPFSTLIVDVTHRCNMACNNCYIPERSIPDMDAHWLRSVLERLPRKTTIRLVGAEPTVRRDLPDLIAMVKEVGHLPVLLTNGLKLADRRYVRELRRAGLRICYLSMNGGFTDDLYTRIDGQPCAGRKAEALHNLSTEHFYISVGMILVRDLNVSHAVEAFERIRQHRQVREFHLRSVGKMGRFMDSPPLTMDELIKVFRKFRGAESAKLSCRSGQSSLESIVGSTQIHLTEWPDLGSPDRGRLSPDGTVQPFFEHVIANDGGY